eukprot:8749464-Pyramimonas_sp.AAC.1
MSKSARIAAHVGGRPTSRAHLGLKRRGSRLQQPRLLQQQHITVHGLGQIRIQAHLPIDIGREDGPLLLALSARSTAEQRAQGRRA